MLKENSIYFKKFQFILPLELHQVYFDDFKNDYHLHEYYCFLPGYLGAKVIIR
jgi:hypothetical protein